MCLDYCLSQDSRSDLQHLLYKWMIVYYFQENQPNLCSFSLPTVIKVQVVTFLMTIREAYYTLQLTLLLLGFKAKQFFWETRARCEVSFFS